MRGAIARSEHKQIRTFTATGRDLEMLAAIARYHGFSKSATITSLIKKEFWRVFPGGTASVKPDRGARVLQSKVLQNKVQQSKVLQDKPAAR